MLKCTKIVSLIILISLLYACNYNSSRMMKTPRNYQFDLPPSDTLLEYMMSNSDVFAFQLYTNDGTSLVDLTAITETNGQRLIGESNINYLIEPNGYAKLPIIGRVKLEGKTIKEAEFFLEEQYSKYYIKPFVKLNVLNRRVTVFPGGSNNGQVIPLTNENMTMLEALGQVGGLTRESKAFKIKLVRGNLKDPKVYLFDFTTLEGIKQADFVLQANDIIYVETRNNFYREWLKDIFPIVSLITSTITLIVVINNL